MGRYIVKRLIYMVPTLIGISLIAFLIIQLPPGDFVTSMVASMTDSGRNVDPGEIERLREIYGFDDPFWLQYWKWISGILLRGDFGHSFEWNRPVTELIWERMGSTLALSLAALLFVWAVSLPDRHLFGDAAAFARRLCLHASWASSASPSPTSSWRWC